MITLGIETSGHSGSVALVRDGAVLGETDLSREGRRHARTLIPELRHLLQDASLSPQDVDTLAVSIGPGSFTGLRVGVACAKVWAFATGASIVAVETLKAVAHQSASNTQRLHVISDAQRGELFVGSFERRAENVWHQCRPIAIIPTDEWIEQLQPTEVVSGPGVAKLQESLAEICLLEPSSHWIPSARSTAALGEQSAQAGDFADPWSLEPKYLRKSAAEEKADARQAR